MNYEFNNFRGRETNNASRARTTAMVFPAGSDLRFPVGFFQFVQVLYITFSDSGWELCMAFKKRNIAMHTVSIKIIWKNNCNQVERNERDTLGFGASYHGPQLAAMWRTYICLFIYHGTGW